MGATVDNPFVSSADDAWDIGVRAAQYFAGANQSASFSIPDTQDIEIRVGCSCSRRRHSISCKQRVLVERSVHRFPVATSLRFQDFDTLWDGLTIADFDTAWAGKTISEFDTLPLDS